MLDNSLSGVVASSGLTPAAVAASAVGALVVAALLIWDRVRIGERTRRIEAKISRMEKIVCLFELQESRRFVMELNAKSEAQADQHDIPEQECMGDVETCISPAASPAVGAGHLDGGKTSKLTDSRRPAPSRKPVRRR